jgi:hypothetical protein
LSIRTGTKTLVLDDLLVSSALPVTVVLTVVGPVYWAEADYDGKAFLVLSCLLSSWYFMYFSTSESGLLKLLSLFFLLC